jgi:hypothetical protein
MRSLQLLFLFLIISSCECRFGGGLLRLFGQRSIRPESRVPSKPVAIKPSGKAGGLMVLGYVINEGIDYVIELLNSKSKEDEEIIGQCFPIRFYSSSKFTAEFRVTRKLLTKENIFNSVAILLDKGKMTSFCYLGNA